MVRCRRCTSRSRPAAASRGFSVSWCAASATTSGLAAGRWCTEARELAFENRKAAPHGGDPLRNRRRTVPTFSEIAEATYEANRSSWRSDKVAKNWRQQMAKYVLPRLGKRSIDAIDQQQVLNRRSDLEHQARDGEARTPVRQTVLRLCNRPRTRHKQSRRRRDHRSAAEGGGGCHPPPRAALHRSAGGARDRRGFKGVAGAKLALRFLVLTPCRSGEVRETKGDGIDFDERVWRIPASRTKEARGHNVPLSNEAIAVLESARALRDKWSDLVFPSPTRSGKPLSDMTLTKVLRDNGLADRTVVHGFRSTFRTWASERTNAPHAVMELALAHTVGSAVEQAYSRSDLSTSDAASWTSGRPSPRSQRTSSSSMPDARPILAVTRVLEVELAEGDALVLVDRLIELSGALLHCGRLRRQRQPHVLGLRCVDASRTPLRVRARPGRHAQAVETMAAGGSRLFPTSAKEADRSTGDLGPVTVIWRFIATGTILGEPQHVLRPVRRSRRVGVQEINGLEGRGEVALPVHTGARPPVGSMASPSRFPSPMTPCARSRSFRATSELAQRSGEAC